MKLAFLASLAALCGVTLPSAAAQTTQELRAAELSCIYSELLTDELAELAKYAMGEELAAADYLAVVIEDAHYFCTEDYDWSDDEHVLAEQYAIFSAVEVALMGKLQLPGPGPERFDDLFMAYGKLVETDRTLLAEGKSQSDRPFFDRMSAIVKEAGAPESELVLAVDLMMIWARLDAIRETWMDLDPT